MPYQVRNGCFATAAQLWLMTYSLVAVDGSRLRTALCEYEFEYGMIEKKTVKRRGGAVSSAEG